MLTNPKIEYLIIELQLKNNHLHSKVDFFFLKWNNIQISRGYHTNINLIITLN
jgi:hypothetical protein